MDWGLPGILTRSLGITVVFSMLASLMVAVTLVPPLGAREFREMGKARGPTVFLTESRPGTAA